MAWSVVPSGFFLGIPSHPFSPSCTPARRGKGPCLLFSAMNLQTFGVAIQHSSTYPPAACGNPWRTHLAYRLALCGSQGAFFAVAANQRGLGWSFLQLAFSPEDAMSSQGLWLCEAFLSALVFWCYLASGPCCFVDLLKRVVVITGWITTGSLHW